MIELLLKFFGIHRKPKRPRTARYFIRPRYAGNITDWQKRESGIPIDWKTGFFLSSDRTQAIIEASHIVRKHVRYKTDAENWGTIEYWPTSKEVLERKREDCDGMAILTWRLLSESGLFHPDEIGMVALEKHMVACWHYMEQDFYVIDNGHLTRDECVLARNLNIKPLFGFNRTRAWKY